jgi:hypothetical protein
MDGNLINIDLNKKIIESDKLEEEPDKDQQDDKIHTTQPISKNQMKKLKRQQHWEENKLTMRKAKRVLYQNLPRKRKKRRRSKNAKLTQNQSAQYL